MFDCALLKETCEAKASIVLEYWSTEADLNSSQEEISKRGTYFEGFLFTFCFWLLKKQIIDFSDDAFHHCTGPI